ncbi:hypothetical protein ACEOB3_04815 [Aeromonas dhakensis]|uniref:hypothetical protein n=1 Tax=Aeromonas dhakensis TaxID=196024 RepID=UPI0028DD996B|nr:hypothetical protein [Aeromonas dhakensis]
MAAGLNPDPVILAAATSKRGSPNHVVLYALNCEKMLSVVFWLVNYVANGNVKMGKIRDITLYKFACRRFLWLPIGQYLSLILPLQTGGGSRLFRTLLAVFCTGCAQAGLPTPGKGAGRRMAEEKSRLPDPWGKVGLLDAR